MQENQQRRQLASEERPIGLRTRPDLILRESMFQGERCWIVKDPLAMKFYRLHDAEFRILEELRNNVNYLVLRETLSKSQPGKTISLEAIRNLVMSFYRSGLLISGSSGQAASLARQQKKERRQKSFSRLASLGSYRFPGIDPTGILDFLYPKVWWIYTTWFSGFAAVFCLIAVALLLCNLEEFYARLPELQYFFSLINLLLMGAVMMFTKTIHELGHGLMCKRFGGECQEIGVMLLLMTPAMYCNTSDSWILRNRWHRIAISAGGMYFELILAAISTFVWWYTNPGWVHYVALNIMFLCSCSTILFNANPLMRLDGYYMLSDFLEIPNLSQRSQRLLHAWIKGVFLGISTPPQRLMPRRHRFAFVAYSIASTIYRWMVFVGVYWLLRTILEPQGMVVLANAVGLVSLVGMLANPVLQSIKYLSYPGRWRDFRSRNVAQAMVLVAAFVVGVCLIPFPDYVLGPVRIRPHQAQSLRVSEPGVLTSIMRTSGDRVKKGDVIAVLENPLLEQQLLELQGELASLQSDLVGYLGNQSSLIDSERLIVETKVSIQNLKCKIATRRQQLDRLVLRAERDGVVFPPTHVPMKTLNDFELPEWSGSPLDAKNLGAYLAANTLICQVGEANDYEAVVLVDQSQMKLVQPKQHVKLLIEQSLSQLFIGEVFAKSHNELTSVPMELSQTHGGTVPVRPDGDGQELPLLKLYEVCVQLPSMENTAIDWLSPGHTGIARINAGYSPLASIAIRHFRNVINFR